MAAGLSAEDLKLGSCSAWLRRWWEVLWIPGIESTVYYETGLIWREYLLFVS